MAIRSASHCYFHWAHCPGTEETQPGTVSLILDISTNIRMKARLTWETLSPLHLTCKLNRPLPTIPHPSSLQHELLPSHSVFFWSSFFPVTSCWERRVKVTRLKVEDGLTWRKVDPDPNKQAYDRCPMIWAFQVLWSPGQKTVTCNKGSQNYNLSISGTSVFPITT